MAITVYGTTTSSPTTRVLACLNEKSLEYEFIQVDPDTVDMKREPFLMSINPFGQIPAFEDGNLKLFESRAITQYIARAYAEKGTPLVSEDSEELATVAVWVEVEAHKFDSPASKLAWEVAIKPTQGLTTDIEVVKEQEALLAKVLDVYEARLAQSTYLGGDTFSLADLHHLPTLHHLMPTRVAAVFHVRPRVTAWAKDILARPSWKKTIQMK